jgi:hypothetical protein
MTSSEEELTPIQIYPRFNPNGANNLLADR